MKYISRYIEAIFNTTYLLTTATGGILLLIKNKNEYPFWMAGIMAMILVAGDAFHLVPRIMLIKPDKEERLRVFLGRGKQIASITMTVFYVVLWEAGIEFYALTHMRLWSFVLYGLAFIRIVLCLIPQNKWTEKDSPIKMGILRNIPFLFQGMLVAHMYFINRTGIPTLKLVWFAIIISFALYIPVVLWNRKISAIGILMLPKTCAYMWIVGMFLAI